jgi:predicted Zn-dependent protease
VAEKALAISSSLGADQTEAFVTATNVLLGQFSGGGYCEITDKEILGLGLRVIKGKGVGFASSSNCEAESIRKSAAKALNLASTVKLPSSMAFPSMEKPSPVEGLWDDEIEEIGATELEEAIEIMQSSTSGFHNSVRDTSGYIRTISQKTLIMNSNGLDVSASETSFESGLSVLAKKANEESEGFESTGGRLWASFSPEEMARKAAAMALRGFDASKIEDGRYVLILCNEPVSEITAFLNALTSSSIARLYLPALKDKRHKQVASGILSLHDDQNKPSGFGSCAFDDEGTPSKRIPLIEKGRLANLIYDHFNSAYEKEAITGGANRNPLKYPLLSSVKTVPFGLVPRRNYMVPPDPIGLNPSIQSGNEKAEEIIAETRNGLLIEMFHYPNRSVEDYSAILRMGVSIVDNGEVNSSGKPCRLVDNLVNILKDVDMISREQKVTGSWFSGLYEAPLLRTKARVVSLA